MSGGRGGGLDGARITRRDFVNTTLVGAGAALLQAPGPAAAGQAGAAWNGYGGVGDYATSNGNTWEVARAAHRIRDHLYDGALPDVAETAETYDLVIVGGGFAGLAALYAFKKTRPNGTCLLLDNQAIFGGFAKANEFVVDGCRVAGAQASMNFVMPLTAEDRAADFWEDLGLPDRFAFATLVGGNSAIRFQRGTSSSLYHGEQCATSGYFFGGNAATPGGWVKDIWIDDLARAPLSPHYKAGLLTLRDYKLRGPPDAAEAARLDGITFAEQARELGVAPEVLSYITQGMCIGGPQISALAARSLPGLDRFAPGTNGAALGERFVSFPGGNTVIARHFVRTVVRDAFPGPDTFATTATALLDHAALDRPGASFRLRHSATVVRVKHQGDPTTADRVDIVYERGGRLCRVEAKAVVLGIGAWVAKHIVADLPAERRAAMDQFLYAPMLIVNVALRNWRFLDKLGFSAARWFDGFGFYGSIRQPMLVGDRPAPFHPDKPIVMTFYVPFPNPDLPLEAQGPAGRTELYATSYTDYEAKIVDQMRMMFAPGGFDAELDIAGIVMNRWGHAFVTPPPGFFHGLNGAPSPLKIAAKPFGRIAFGQSGLEDWLGAAHAGKRAMAEVSPTI